MAGKVDGVTHPSDLADDDTALEAWFDNVTNSIIALDAAVGKDETIHASATTVTISTTSETNLMSFSVPAGALGTNNVIKYRIYGRHVTDGAGDVAITLKVKYGSTTMITSANTYLEGTATRDGTFEISGFIKNRTATDSQLASMLLVGYMIGEGTASTQPPYGKVGAATEDSTGALTFAITLQMGAALADVYMYFCEAVLVDLS